MVCGYFFLKILLCVLVDGKFVFGYEIKYTVGMIVLFFENYLGNRNL